ncbi:MAG: DUF4231 domain-containing protein [Chloroflexi bacterium]|nr:DUF4231 domain-containing protein [Chloroflexota bacterium]
MSVQEIIFSNGNRAKAISASADSKASDLVTEVGLKRPNALIFFTGGAAGLDQLDDASKAHLVQLISRGVARGAGDVGATIIDGGTRAGVMAMIGQGVADRGHRTQLVGIAPQGKVTFPGGPAEGSIVDGAPLDENHSHFVLVESAEWSGEQKILFAVAEELSREVPDLTILVNGGGIAKAEVLQSVRNKWPILIVEGSGRLADEIAGLKKEAERVKAKMQDAMRNHTGEKIEMPFIADPMMAEIVEDGEIVLFPIQNSPSDLQLQVTQLLGGGDTLQLTWHRFATFDYNAKLHQKRFFNLQWFILYLGVLATATALSIAYLDRLNISLLNDALRFVVILAPITLSVLIAVASKFNPGSKYILLRAAAEAVKGEIYAYRARAAQYGELKTPGATREMVLEQKSELVARQLMQTDVKDSALLEYTGPIPPAMAAAEAPDDGFSFLSPERYIEVRLGDQIRFHRNRIGRLDRQLRRAQWAIYLFGGLGTLLAAIKYELWIALTTSLVGAFTSFLQYQQVEFTLSRNNQTLTELVNLQAWWSALTTEEQAKPENIDRLVGSTERVLDEQNAAWVGRMRDALAELRAQQERDRERLDAQKKETTAKK